MAGEQPAPRDMHVRVGGLHPQKGPIQRCQPLHAAKNPPNGGRTAHLDRLENGRSSELARCPKTRAAPPHTVTQERCARSIRQEANEAAATGLGLLREVHQEMVEAVLHGEGMERVAVLASERVGRPVAIVVPSAGVATVVPRSEGRGLAARAPPRRRRAAATAPRRCRRRSSWPPPSTRAASRSASSRCWPGRRRRRPEAGEVLHLAALAAMTGVALDEAREQEAARLRGGLLEELREREVPAEDVLRRGARLGSDLSGGAIVVVTEVRSTRPRQLTALVSDDYPGAIAELLDGRIYALLPAGARRLRRGCRPTRRAASPSACESTAPRRSRRCTATRPTCTARSRRRSWCSRSCPATSAWPRPCRRRARASTGCCSACSRRIRTRCAASSRTRSGRWCATTIATTATCSPRSRPTSRRTAT